MPKESMATQADLPLVMWVFLRGRNGFVRYISERQPIQCALGAMYLDWIRLQNFRTFVDVEITLLHAGTDFEALQLPKPKFPNLNLLLGNNGQGKSAFLKGVALAALGPAVSDAGIYPYRLVRQDQTVPMKARSRRTLMPTEHGSDAVIEARFRTHEQDHMPLRVSQIISKVSLQRRGDLERLSWTPHGDDELWRPIFDSESDAFFVVGYGATRHVEASQRANPSLRNEKSFARAQRVQSLFQESYPLITLTSWLPRLKKANPGRYAQVEHLINRLMGRGHYTFTGELDGEEYLFDRKGLKIPFPALSDGYRAYLGWIGDLLYHVVQTCPRNKKLIDNQGIVMIDELDLHLHPKWQMTVLPVLAKELPNIQFIVTSHSPLLVGSIEWMNIIVMEPKGASASVPRRVKEPVHGLDADQVLLTDFFGMDSTRASSKQMRLKELTLEARNGSLDAANELVKEMSRGAEGE
jgi:AAA domain, putative AbiEii toxin, Type IV TA system